MNQQPQENENNATNWSVWRLDDNDNSFMIEDNLTKAEALKLAQAFEAKGHKQLYWAKPNATLS
ncbi:hypothetical protein [Candidatus Albibeggiatoa sp. nov. NOAA]|uniref:hypothetical protein n=1 Tax=Candidatus Albibeggiatoa sp. nov. NOAA TaxID=3162724 RepID=UPI0032FE0F38|nr:hypothetical protein [Thiotrichaceae bacterium]